MNVPKWITTYKDFPEIPPSKRWSADLSWTLEQQITNKLIGNAPLTKEDEAHLREALNFYKIVLPKLKSLDLTSITDEQIEEFKGYYEYVFNYNVLSSNELWVDRTYRLVVNEDVLGKRERIRDRKFLSYPSIDIVKKLNKYNRASTPNTTVFYSGDSINTTLMERKPKPGDLVTVGMWKKKNPNKRLFAYPISHSPQAIQANIDVKKGYMAFQEMKKKNHPLLMEFMETALDFLGHEFSKPVAHHRQYFYSAHFGERILTYDTDPNWRYDCIVYPSVQNRFLYENVAMRPEVLDNDFKLAKVFEFEVTETFYNSVVINRSTEEINYVKYKNLEATDWIESDGYIVW